MVANILCTYVYDVYGQNIEQDETSGGSTTVNRFGYDPGYVWVTLNGSNQLQSTQFYLNGQPVVSSFISALALSSSLVLQR